ncbi:hypothetical protein PR202_gn00408 [Eleusine coracana subsp. coracana]|uniref:SBP-type domain-containing protein n=1 Tax=Eleusine coracana subsp. coracana TaxID=191504 RepID=A0AAV5G396_ELECO|nr:hypothetical protein PR202_gn00408 [Eleusine coracana subsp. coracana]
MDWDLKMPVSWDLAELEHDAVPAISVATAPVATAASGIAAAAAAAAAARGAPPTRAECSVDLKLGGLGEFGAADVMKEPKPPTKGPPPTTSAAATVVPSASPLKRPRSGPGGGGGGGPQCPSCAVDGCKADLSKCRDYHRRHKVCEAHSKTPVVVVAGREMRFCQQCSRFHLLAEFDEAKRSCRKRLDGHNRRRRKPQPDNMNSGSFMTSQQGILCVGTTRFSSFVAPRPEPSWSGIIKSEDSSFYTHQVLNGRPHFAGLTPTTYSKEGRRFPFLQDGDQVSFGTGGAASTTLEVCQPLLKTAVAPPESSSSNKIFSPDGLTPVLDSDCALSLLSSPANSSSVDVSRMVQPTEHIPMAQPLVPSLQQFASSPGWFACSQVSASSGGGGGGFTCPSMESEQLKPRPGAPAPTGHEMNYHGIFHVGGEGSSDGTSPSHPFSWH